MAENTNNIDVDMKRYLIGNRLLTYTQEKVIDYTKNNINFSAFLFNFVSLLLIHKQQIYRRKSSWPLITQTFVDCITAIYFFSYNIYNQSHQDELINLQDHNILIVIHISLAINNQFSLHSVVLMVAQRWQTIRSEGTPSNGTPTKIFVLGLIAMVILNCTVNATSVIMLPWLSSGYAICLITLSVTLCLMSKQNLKKYGHKLSTKMLIKFYRVLRLTITFVYISTFVFFIRLLLYTLGTRKLVKNPHVYIALASTINCLPSLLNGVAFLIMDKYIGRLLRLYYNKLKRIFNSHHIRPVDENIVVRYEKTPHRKQFERHSEGVVQLKNNSIPKRRIRLIRLYDDV